MLQEDVRFELVTEDAQGFNPLGYSFDSLSEAESGLATFQQRLPGEGAFIVRVTLAREAGPSV